MRLKVIHLMLAAVLLDSAVTEKCPAGCDCINVGECSWSIHAVDIMEETTRNSSIWIKQAIKIMEYACDDEMHTVCCCGTKQLAPDLEPLPTDFNRTAVLEVQDRFINWGSITSFIKTVFNPAKFLDKLALLKKALEDCSDMGSIITAFTEGDQLSNLKEGLADTQLSNEAIELMKKVFKAIKAFMAKISTCISGLVTSLVGSKREAQDRSSTWSVLSYSLSGGGGFLLHGEGEIGMAQEMDFVNSRLRKMAFMGNCQGFKLDAGYGGSFNIGLWRNLNDIPGDSWTAGLGFEIPVISVGIGAELVMNMDNEIIGVLINIGLGGFSVSPLDLSFFTCNTSPWKIDNGVPGCRATDKQDVDCCSKSPCKVGQGPCKSDSECMGDSSDGTLICGTDNCVKYDSLWTDSTLDCCTKVCDASISDMDCCTPESRCLEGEGDCDGYGFDCAEGLICGRDTCKMFDMAWSYKAARFPDCCVKGCLEKNVDYWGDDVTQLRTDTWQECSKACETTPSHKCTHWTWAADNYEGHSTRRLCHLKKPEYGLPERRSKTGLFSGVIGAKDCGTCVDFEVDYLGSDLPTDNFKRVWTWQHCAQLCYDRSDCYYWTWVGYDYSDEWMHKRCHLKSNKHNHDVEISNVRTNKKGLVSGRKDWKDCRGPLENKGEDCWAACHHARWYWGIHAPYTEKSFPCDWCGTEGLCAEVSNVGFHQCIRKKKLLERQGQRCDNVCKNVDANASKKCDYCGTEGWCSVKKNKHECSAIPAWCAKVYDNEGYNIYKSSWEEIINIGSKNLAHNNAVRSVRVTPGCKLVLYRDVDYKDEWPLTLTSSKWDLGSHHSGYNEQVSSVTCTCS